MLGFYKFLHAFDKARVIPRLTILFYGYQMYWVQQWFQALPSPNGAQSAFVSVITGAGALILNFYMQTGTDWAKEMEAQQRLHADIHVDSPARGSE